STIESFSNLSDKVRVKFLGPWDQLVFAGTINKNDSREESLAARRRWHRKGKTLWGCPCHQSNKGVLKSRFASLDLILIVITIIHGCEEIDHRKIVLPDKLCEFTGCKEQNILIFGRHNSLI